MIKLSVIVPIFNVEKYLEQCVDSIINQTYKNIEIILVDDGSPDNCGAICDEYALKDERINVIHKENAGQSDARNRGVEKATGDYLVFADSDDYFDDLCFFERLVGAIEHNCNPDVVSYYRKQYYERKQKIERNISPFSRNSFKKTNSYFKKINYLIKKKSLNVTAWLNAINRKFFLDNALFFKKGIVSEDIDWAIRLYVINPRIVFLDDASYVYRVGRVGSTTTTIKEKNLIDLYNIIDEHSEKYKNEVTKIKILDFIAYYYIMLCGLLILTPNSNEKNFLVCKIKEKSWLLNYDFCFRVKLVKWISRIFGIDTSIRLLGFFVKYIRR